MSSSSLLNNVLINRFESISEKENNTNSLFVLNEILKVLQHIDGDLHEMKDTVKHIDGDLHEIVDINTKILEK